MGMMFRKRCKTWQRENPKWELCCDIGNTDRLYVQWDELPKEERMHWIGKYNDCAKDAFEEFGSKQCKVEKRVLDCNMNLHKIEDWPNGHAMTVFKTNGVCYR